MVTKTGGRMMERPKKASGVEKNRSNLNEVGTEAMQKLEEEGSRRRN